MAGETGQIRRDIEATRREIDAHLQQLGGQVRGELNVESQVRRNLPQILAGAAVFGLAAGALFGGGTSRRMSRVSKELAKEQSRLAREIGLMARERGRPQRAFGLAELEEHGFSSDIP